ncbi:MAG: WD40 repeat domain-containing protein [Sulfurimonadaceae bacterium]
MTFLISSIFATSFQQPSKMYNSSGAVVDIVVENKKLYSATDASCVDVFDIESAKVVEKITVSKITDFMGDVIDSKVYSIDVLDSKVVLLSQGAKGFRRVHTYKDGKLDEVISIKDQLYIAKVAFLDKDTLLLGLLSNEIIAYEIATKKMKYRKQVSFSKFSDFALDEKKEVVVVADESGDLKLHKTVDGTFMKKLSGQNLDNVFQVDYKNGIIATAGQDRRVVIYDAASDSAYYKTAPFLIYGVGLSPSGRLVAYASDEQNNVTVFNTSTKSTKGHYGGNKMTLSKILFLSEKEFLVSSDDNIINLYDIK